MLDRVSAGSSLRDRIGMQRYWMPTRNSECLCGSGEKFKRCCSPQLCVDSEGKLVLKDAESSLVAARAEFCRYSIWHRRHTIPLMNKDPVRARELLLVDVAALRDFAMQIVRCELAAGAANIDGFLSRVRGHVAGAEWLLEVAFLEVFCAGILQEQRSKAERILRTLDRRTIESDYRLLSMELDFNSSLSPTRRAHLVSLAIELAPGSGERLHYRLARAVLNLLAGDSAACNDEIWEAREEFEAAEIERSSYDRWIYAKSIVLGAELGVARCEPRLILPDVISLLAETSTAEEHRAQLWRLLGDARRACSEFAQAADAYSTCVAIGGPSAAIGFQAECLWELGRMDDAKRLLESEAIDRLDWADFADCAFSCASVALRSRHPDMLERASELLRRVPDKELYFTAHKYRLIQALNASRDDEIELDETSAWQRFLERVSRIVMLQPNIGGIGLNLNVLFEKRPGARLRKRPPRMSE